MLCASVLQVALLLSGTDATPAAAKPAVAAAAAPSAAAPAAAAPAAKAPAPETYSAARQATAKTGKPLVIMVSTDWCPPCQVMKRTILPRVREHGLFRKVAFAHVNPDEDAELANQLTGGGPIPQLVMFRKTSKGWLRKKLIGGQSVETVEEFIKEGLAMDKAEKKAEKKTAPEDKSRKHG
jgi:thiol-disulfide isomerase/thioredoxin